MNKPTQRQLHFEELEPFLCSYQCLQCPFPDEDCPRDDPDIGMFDRVEYPEFFWWRLDHLTESQSRQLMELGSDIMIITPDCLDQFYPEPKDPMQTRCPRCLSTEVIIGYPDIKCQHCGYSEPLIDFTISKYWHLALKEANIGGDK